MRKYLVLPIIFLVSTTAFSVENTPSESDLLQKYRDHQNENSKLKTEHLALETSKNEDYKNKVETLYEQMNLDIKSLEKDYEFFLTSYFEDLKNNTDQLKAKYQDTPESLQLIDAVYLLYSKVEIMIDGGTKPGSISGIGSIDTYSSIEDKLYTIIEKAEKTQKMPKDIFDYYINSRENFLALVKEKKRVYEVSQMINKQDSIAYNKHSKDFANKRQELITTQVVQQRAGDKTLQEYKEKYGYPVEEDDGAPVSEEELNLLKNNLKDQGRLNSDPGVDKRIEELKNLDNLKLPSLEIDSLEKNK